MAEKDEFIFVLPVEESDELRNITPYCNGCTFWPCDEECINRKKPMTRQEAIERMAKAITFEMYKAFPNPNKEVNKRYNSYINYAKAALNALLEEK